MTSWRRGRGLQTKRAGQRDYGRGGPRARYGTPVPAGALPGCRATRSGTGNHARWPCNMVVVLFCYVAREAAIAPSRARTSLELGSTARFPPVSRMAVSVSLQVGHLTLRRSSGVPLAMRTPDTPTVSSAGRWTAPHRVFSLSASSAWLGMRPSAVNLSMRPGSTLASCVRRSS